MIEIKSDQKSIQKDVQESIQNYTGQLEWNLWLTDKLKDLELKHDYNFLFPSLETTEPPLGCNHLIYKETKKRFLGIPYTGKETVALISSEPTKAKPKEGLLLDFLKYEGLGIKVENLEYQSKLVKIAAEFVEQFKENAKIN